MKTLKLPYDDESAEKLLIKIKTDDPTPIEDRTDNMLNLIIMAMMYKNPQDRPSCFDLLQYPKIKDNLRKLGTELNNVEMCLRFCENN